MKKTLLLLCFLPLLSFAQDEMAPFRLSDGTVWNGGTYSVTTDPFQSNTLGGQYLISGDTVINGMTYARIWHRDTYYRNQYEPSAF